MLIMAHGFPMRDPISIRGTPVYSVASAPLRDTASASNKRCGDSRPTALPASQAQSGTQHRRRIVEFCCGEHSLIGARAPADCEVIRLTIADDLTTAAGLAKAIAAVSEPGVPTLLFGALPCTGGSPYQYLNWQLGPKTRAKICRHRAIFRVLWRHFKLAADACLGNGGRIGQKPACTGGTEA